MTKKMAEFIMLALLICMISSILCFAGGYLAGRAIEKAHVNQIIEKFYEDEVNK